MTNNKSRTADLLILQYDPKQATSGLPPLFLNLPTLAAMLSLSASTVQALVRSGELPQPRQLSGNRVAWLYREIAEWAEARPVSDIPPPHNTGAKKPRATARRAPQDALTAA